MQIDEFLSLVRRRRSVRRFKPDPIPDEYIEKVLDAARWTMSGSNGQPWEFIVVKNQETKNKLAEVKIEDEKLAIAMETSRVKEMRQPLLREVPNVVPQVHFQEAPVIIVLCADPRTAQASVLARLCDRRWVVDENMANVAHIIHLAVAACGLGSEWVTINRATEEVMKPILGIPPIIRLFSMVPIGYPAYEPRVPRRRELSEIVHYEKYDMSKYRSHEEVQEFIRLLRERTKSNWPIK